MSTLPPCPACQADYTYQDAQLLLCPACGHEWSANQAESTEQTKVIRDSAGNT